MLGKYSFSYCTSQSVSFNRWNSLFGGCTIWPPEVLSNFSRTVILLNETTGTLNGLCLCFQYFSCFEFSTTGSIWSFHTEETIFLACAKTLKVMLPWGKDHRCSLISHWGKFVTSLQIYYHSLLSDSFERELERSVLFWSTSP